MKFRLEKCPATFSSEDRICRGCEDVRSEFVLKAVGTNYSFASCATCECQETVKNKILAALAQNKKPLWARIFRHA